MRHFVNLPVTFLLVALALLCFAIAYRRRAGFRGGKTVSHDNVTLRSERLRLVGRPDRIVERGKMYIVEDKKSALRVYESQRVQMAVYMILVEEHYGVRPTHAVVVLGDGRREEVRYTPELRQQALDVAEQIRHARRDLDRPIPVVAIRAKCRGCAQRQNCEQRVI